MITEQSLKQRCTSEIIKRMVELAKGFKWEENIGCACYINGNKKHRQNWCEVVPQLFIYEHIFPLLFHRAVEKICDDGINIYRVKDNFHSVDYIYNESSDDKYNIENYQPESLTACECAMLDCLIDIFNEENK